MTHALPNKIKVLLAEDAPSVRLFIADALEALGAQVESVDNAASAAEKAVSEHYDLIFLDVFMPAGGGIAAAQAIMQALPVAPPVIGISGSDAHNQKAACLAVGMAAYLQKPVLYDDLAALVQKYARPKFDDSFISDLRTSNPDKAARFVALTLKNAQELLDEAQSAFQAHDMAGLRAAAHALYGVAVQAGGAQLANAAKALEQAPNAQNIAALQQGVAALKTHLA